MPFHQKWTDEIFSILRDGIKRFIIKVVVSSGDVGESLSVIVSHEWWKPWQSKHVEEQQSQPRTNMECNKFKKNYSQAVFEIKQAFSNISKVLQSTICQFSEDIFFLKDWFNLIRWSGPCTTLLTYCPPMYTADVGTYIIWGAYHTAAPGSISGVIIKFLFLCRFYGSEVTLPRWFNKLTKQDHIQPSGLQSWNVNT